MSGISIDERGFGADTNRYSWREVEAIGIRTTDEGPLSEDVFWQFLLRDGSVVEVPGEAVGRHEVGVLQDRFPGLDNRKLIEAVRHAGDRSARYYCVIVLVRGASDPTPLIAEGEWRGEIVLEPRGSGGFGYDPYFYLPALGRTAAELPLDEKNRVSHRGLALAALTAKLRTL